jgi:hypothetical protein
VKKVIIACAMLASLGFSAAVAFGAGLGFTLPIPWYLNDKFGQYRKGSDTWLTLKNNSGEWVTLTLDYYDDGAISTIATTDTIVLGPQAVAAVYTGKPSYNEDKTFIGTGFRMYAGADRGSINVRFLKFGAYTKVRQIITGYQTIENYPPNDLQSFGINLSYTRRANRGEPKPIQCQTCRCC